jgi:uncharacterized membrane protein YvlD (DUF360 family)
VPAKEIVGRLLLSARHSMDIIAHALWTTAVAKLAREKTRQPLRLGWAAFWGVFPDLFSFAIPAVVRTWWYVTGTTHSLLPDAHSAPRFQFVWQLYHSSHSLLVFAAVFGLVWTILHRPVLEMLGWALHILIDIFTHEGIFAVHFLWPLSNYGFNGIRWENRWFMALNYAALLAVLAWLWVRTRKARSRTSP